MSPWLLDPTITFLNHGSYGSCPRPVLERQDELRARMESDPIRFFHGELEPLLDETRAKVAALAGASPEDIALVPSVTHASNALLASISFRPGDEVLVTSHGYGAVTNAAVRWTERAGARVVAAPVPFPIESPDEVVDAILATVTPATRLVVVDQVTSPSALVFPVDRVVSACAERGVDVFVDAAHAPGMVALNLNATNAAYTAGNLHKWVCAPKGAGFLHVRADRRDTIRSLVTSHGASAMRTDRSRFHLEFDWLGTDDPTAILAAPRALEFLGSLDPDGLRGVQAKNNALVREARTMLCTRLGLTPPCPESMLGSMASLLVPGGMPAMKLHDRLYDEHRIQLQVLPWPSYEQPIFRISAQRYNTMADYERLALALASLL